MSDFRRVGDIVRPHSVIEVDLANEEILTRITLQILEVKKQLPLQYFDDPVHIVPEL